MRPRVSLASAVEMRRTILVMAIVLVLAVAFIDPLGAHPTSLGDLHRPLRLHRLAPGAVCPVSRVDSRIDWQRVRFPGSPGIGRGPVYPGLSGPGARMYAMPDVQYGGVWAGGKVFWYVRPSYRGRVLIRGRRLDGPQWMRFDGRRLPPRELRIEPNDTVGWEGQPPGSRGVPSSVRVRAPGCYGVQIDGTTFSRVVVFTVEISS
jgi:hypothetical protein